MFGWEGLQLTPILTQEEKEKWKTMKGLSEVLCSNFKPWCNSIVISLQFHKLHKKDNECMQEWMGSLRTKAEECPYKGYDRILTEQLMNKLNDDGMVGEISKGVATLENTEDVTSQCILL